MKPKTSIEDLIGLGQSKLGFFKEVQVKIAELQKTNRELARQRQQVQVILDGITDIVAVISPDYRIRSVNNSFYDTYARRPPDDDLCYDVFRGRSQPCETCMLRDALATNRVCRVNAIIPVGGRNRQFAITASPLRDRHGSPTDILVVKRDVTVEKEFQAKYYHAEKMATIGLLAAGVAHEINNPLTAIRGFTEGLQRRVAALAARVFDKTAQADFDESLAIILQECRRCSGIVRSLLTFSPRKTTQRGQTDLNQLVKTVLRILHHRLKRYPDNLIRLHLDDALPSIHGDVAEIEQVILNLVLNALDAIGDNGTIDIRTFTCRRGQVCLEVADNGCGIPPDDLPKLFEPFFTTKPVGKGIGIGLSTCYHIIRSHGGEIEVASVPGEGARFTVRLPVVPATGAPS